MKSSWSCTCLSVFFYCLTVYTSKKFPKMTQKDAYFSQFKPGAFSQNSWKRPWGCTDRMSLHSKCLIVGNHVSRFNYDKIKHKWSLLTSELFMLNMLIWNDHWIFSMHSVLENHYHILGLIYEISPFFFYYSSYIKNSIESVCSLLIWRFCKGYTSSIEYDSYICRDASHSDFCGIVPIFKADFHITI